MLIPERFLSGVVKIHGKHPVSTDGGTWYPMACRFLKLNHPINSSIEKRLIERRIQCIEDRAECFDLFACKLKHCKLKHVMNWSNLFVYYHNSELKCLGEQI
jgi:putative transposase